MDMPEELILPPVLISPDNYQDQDGLGLHFSLIVTSCSI